MVLNEIKAVLSRLPESKAEIATVLLEKAEFQNAQLLELQAIIKERGWVEDYRNGEHQSGRKKSAEADSYLALSKVFNGTMKLLNDWVAEAAKQTEDDELMSFIKGGKKIAR